ncbi:hypothetical protein IGI39_004926 [Enterococcus sp. AZ135]|uniref:MarR family transcriptional regulator n=1 Tax=unclassified Enterococcus TaxID=2608891 RepID=UPI003F2937D7
MNLSEELANVIEKMVDEMVDEKLKILEETYFAKSKQTLFTKAELSEKWGCTVGTVDKKLKKAGVKSVGKRGSELEFKLDEAEEAKAFYDGEQLHNHELNWKMRAMQQN